MKKTIWTQTDRRNFLIKALPVCAFSCLGVSKVFAKSPFLASTLQEEEKHKFDKALPGPKMTYRQMAALQDRSFIEFARFLQKEIGKERVIELIKKQTDERELQQAKDDLKRLGKSDFKSFVSMFRDPQMEASLNMEIIQDTDTVFALKVTGCLAAESFLPYKAGDIGYAAACWGDYIWTKGFNPKIKLVRDKTLMQGYDYCNHKYIWTG